MNTRFLTVLTTLVFLGFSISVLAAPPSKCEPWPQCKDDGGGGGGEPTSYDVIDGGGDMGVYGTDWESGNTGWIEWGQFWPTGTGFLDLRYFLDGGPFTGGGNCFGANGGIKPMVQGGFTREDNGSALGRLWFDGRTDDNNKSVRYMLTLEGRFADDSFPSASNILTMYTWEMKIEGGGKRIRTISCTGAGDFDDPAVINIEEKS